MAGNPVRAGALNDFGRQKREHPAGLFSAYFLSQGPAGLRGEKSSEARTRRKRGRFRLKKAKKPIKAARALFAAAPETD